MPNPSCFTRDGLSFTVAPVPWNMGFWPAFANGTWEPETFDILRRFLDRESTYVDIGAWVGPTVLYAAKIARRCFAVEPDEQALELLRYNLEVNECSNVDLFEGAIGAATGTATLFNSAQWGDSMSSLVAIGEQCQATETLTLQDYFERYGIGTPSLIKIDIEGSEEGVLPQARDFLADLRSPMDLSIHCPNYRDGGIEAVADALSVFKTIYLHGAVPIGLSDLPRDGFYSVLGVF